jgi:hypothetical protein
LVISNTQDFSITLQQPSFTVTGNPAPTVEAYIGIEGGIEYSGSEVTGFIGLPCDVSAGDYTFTNLTAHTTYTIIVVAQNELGYWVSSISQRTSLIKPALMDLSIESSGDNFVTLAQPSLSITGNPIPTIKAWIGVDGTIAIAGSTVTGFEQGPVDVSAGGCTFTALSPSTAYIIFVVAENEAGYDVKSITLSTSLIAPVLKPLSISAYDDTSIALNKPAFVTAGNPAPSVNAWIGIDGTITASGTTVSNSLQGPIDVSAQGYQFSGLTAGTNYTIYVVALNSGGYDIENLDVSTLVIIPVMKPLIIASFNTVSITIAQPLFSVEGNPVPSVEVWLGLKGTITASGSTINGFLLGPVDAAAQSHTFTGLSADTNYTVYAVAKNSGGFDTRLIDQRTASVIPVLDALSISATEATAITLDQPTFSSAGVPAPTVKAYIGKTGIITASGSIISNAVYGPVDVALQGFKFTGLSANTGYTIYVTAVNNGGYDIKSKNQTTSMTVPVMNALTAASGGTTSIILSRPTFSTAGDPSPTVEAWIGLQGTITVAGSTVSNPLSPTGVDVSSSDHTFTGLSGSTNYTIIVVSANAGGYDVKQINQSTSSVAPVLKPLTISAADTDSITLDNPAFSTSGNPAPSVSAWIGEAGIISVAGMTVSGSAEGPVTITSGPYTFSSLAVNTTYQIVVIASNAAGYDVKTITQSTASIAPTLNTLATSAVDATSITLDQPTFYIAGNPIPTVLAYIGLSGTMSVTGTSVTGFLQGPVSVASGSYRFGSLSAGGIYKIAVIAENSAGYDVKTITQYTSTIAPVLNPLSILSAQPASITLGQPTFVIPGNPTPTVTAWLGVKGTISVTGSTVTNQLIGPCDAASGAYSFTGLSTLNYEIIVIAQNPAGYDVRTIDQNLNFIAPQLNTLSISTTPTAGTITLDQPTLSIAGFPTPSVTAYIGIPGTITVSGSTVSGFIASKDVRLASAMFTGLTQVTTYQIIVVALNSSGFDTETISKTTLSGEKNITAFSLGGYACTISEPDITVNIPFWKNLDSLAAVFTTTGVSVSIDGITQTSGSVRDFNSPVTYTVTAQDGSVKNYTVQASNMGSVSTLPLSTSAAEENEINAPMGMTDDGASLYIANTGNNTILMITSPSASPVITCHAGIQGTAGTTDGALRHVATFTSPRGLGFQGTKLFVADGSHAIRRISPNLNKVQTLYTGLSSNPYDIASDGSFIYAAIGGFIYSTTTGVLAPLNAAALGTLSSIIYTGGYLYIVDSTNHCVWKMSTLGAATLLAGSGSPGMYGAVDGIGTGARFHNPQGIATDETNLYVTDGNSQIIRKICLATMRVRTIAGSTYTQGSSDGMGGAAKFNKPEGVSVIGNTLYVVDSSNNAIRKIQ